MIPWTVARQAPLSMEFSRPEYCSGLPLPFPGDLPSPGIKPRSPACRWILYRLSHQGSSFLLSGSVLTYSSKTLWTVVRQTPLSIRFLRQGYWCRVPLPSPGDLPDPVIEPASPMSPVLQADSSPAEPLGIIKHRKFKHYTRLLSYVQFICKCSRVSH